MNPPSPISQFTELLQQLVPAPMTPETVARHVATRNQTSLAAAQAAGALRQLFTTLEASSLQRLTVAHENGAADLTDLASAAMRTKDAFDAERRAAKQVLGADAASRVKYDGVAMTLLGQAMEGVKGSKAAAQAATLNDSELRKSLSSAGLSVAEVDRIVLARADDQDTTAQHHRDAAETALARADALQRYLGDPLRDLSKLGTDLAAEIVERTDLAARHHAARATPHSQTASEAATAAAG
jgi:hypothetical protein